MCTVFIASGSAELRTQIRAALPASVRFAGEARDGESAMPMLHDLLPDVLVTDAELPFSDGFALAAFVRRAFPWIQIIMLSGRDDAQHRRRAEAMGVHQYLIKPARTYELVQALQRAADALDRLRRLLHEDFLRADRIVSPERRALEHSLFQWLETGALPADASPLPRIGKYCRVLTFSRTEGDHARVTRGVLRLMERSSEGLFAVDLPQGPALAATADDPALLESMAYGAAYSACLATERFAGARVQAQVGRQVENSVQLREGWLENLALADRQPENCRVLGVEDADCAGLILHAKNYIHENCARPGLSAAQTARTLGMTAAHLCVLFEQETGESFTDYLTGVRVLQARQLLEKTKMRISAVAERVGYDEPECFAAAFRRRTGLTPLECRRKAAEC